MVAKPTKKKEALPFEPGVIIPYSRLVDLLNVAAQAEERDLYVRQLRSEITYLRIQFSQLMELFNSYQD